MRNFPDSRFLSGTRIGDRLQEFAAAGLAGGAIDDGLVGAAAREHRLPLISCDRRAEPAYRALGVRPRSPIPRPDPAPRGGADAPPPVSAEIQRWQAGWLAVRRTAQYSQLSNVAINKQNPDNHVVKVLNY